MIIYGRIMIIKNETADHQLLPESAVLFYNIL